MVSTRKQELRKRKKSDEKEVEKVADVSSSENEEEEEAPESVSMSEAKQLALEQIRQEEEELAKIKNAKKPKKTKQKQPETTTEKPKIPQLSAEVLSALEQHSEDVEEEAKEPENSQAEIDFLARKSKHKKAKHTREFENNLRVTVLSKDSIGINETIADSALEFLNRKTAPNRRRMDKYATKNRRMKPALNFTRK